MTLKEDKARQNTVDLDVGSDTLSFAVRKFTIIFPYYIIPWIVAFTFLQISPTVTWKTVIKNAIKSLFTVLEINMSGLGGYQVLGPAWYISAMILTAMILYPILLKHYDYFVNVLSLLLALFI